MGSLANRILSEIIKEDDNIYSLVVPSTAILPQLYEDLSIKKLLKSTDLARKSRASRGTSVLRIKETFGDDFDGYRYVIQLKGGKKYKGYIHFKNGIREASKVEVSCSCPDFKYRWEVANTKKNASKVIYSNGADPVHTNPTNKTQLCKHLVRIKSEIL